MDDEDDAHDALWMMTMLLMMLGYFSFPSFRPRPWPLALKFKAMVTGTGK